MTGAVQSSTAIARRLLAPLHDDFLRLLQELIRTDSTARPPHGNETPAQLVLRDFLTAHHVKAELYPTEFITNSLHTMVRKDRNYADRHNLSARLTGSGRGKSLLLNGHMDTVPPAAAKWSASPWSGIFENGRVYGLGSFDMKGGLVAEAAVLCALQAGDVRLSGDLLFESVVDEEWGGCGGSLGARLRGDTADACVIAEGTQLQICRATRGGAVIDLAVEAGDSAHYFSNSEVVSPANHIGRLLQWLDGWRQRRAGHQADGAYASFPDPTPLQILAVDANRVGMDVPLSVPMMATIRFYVQFLPSEDAASVLEEIKQSLGEWEKRDPFFASHSAQWKPLYDPPLLGHELAEEHPWTQCLLQSAKAVISPAPELTAAPYPCDAFLLHREFGIPTLLFGPCGEGAHNADENVEFASVIQTAETLLVAALEWCNG